MKIHPICPCGQSWYSWVVFWNFANASNKGSTSLPFQPFRTYVILIYSILCLTNTRLIQDDQKVSVALMITIHSSAAQRLFDHPVPAPCNQLGFVPSKFLSMNDTSDALYIVRGLDRVPAKY